MDTSSVTRPRRSFTSNPQPEPRSLQVSGLQCFEESRWRECLLYYLFGIWSDQSSVTYRPKVNLGEITLRLNVDAKEYFAYGTPVELEHPTFAAAETLVVGCTQLEVEQGLVRFVKNNRIKMLVILMRRGGEVRLWKKPQRSRFGITSKAISPSLTDAVEAESRG